MEPIKYKDLDPELQAMIATPKTIVNHSDGEDLTNRGDVLKFADRYKDTFGHVEKGYIILRKHIADIITENGHEDDNVLTQDMLSRENTIYEVRYDFNLNGQTITVPNRCVLLFKGGKFRNGNLNCNGTVVRNVAGDIYDVIPSTGEQKLSSGTTRWTSDGFIEWWNGTEWFNPYRVLDDTIRLNIENVCNGINTINTNVANGFKTINEAIQAEATARQTKDNELASIISAEITAREQGDVDINTKIAEVEKKHTDDVEELTKMIEEVNARVTSHINAVNSKFHEVISDYKASDDQLRAEIVQGLKDEADARTKQIGEEIQEVYNYIDKFKSVQKANFTKLKNEFANVVKRVDSTLDTTNKALNQYREILEKQQASITDLQNRVERLQDADRAYDDNLNKYLVRFVLADTGKIIGGQYVEPGKAAIAPDVPEGAYFDKPFTEVNEDMIIKVIV